VRGAPCPGAGDSGVAAHLYEHVLVEELDAFRLVDGERPLSVGNLLHLASAAKVPRPCAPCEPLQGACRDTVSTQGAEAAGRRVRVVSQIRVVRACAPSDGRFPTTHMEPPSALSCLTVQVILTNLSRFGVEMPALPGVPFPGVTAAPAIKRALAGVEYFSSGFPVGESMIGSQVP
jgi:hypothetical protein